MTAGVRIARCHCCHYRVIDSLIATFFRRFFLHFRLKGVNETVTDVTDHGTIRVFCVQGSTISLPGLSVLVVKQRLLRVAISNTKRAHHTAVWCGVDMRDGRIDGERSAMILARLYDNARGAASHDCFGRDRQVGQTD